MSKRFLTDVIAQAADMPATAAGRLAGEVVAAIRAGITETGRFSLPEASHGAASSPQGPGWCPGEWRSFRRLGRWPPRRNVGPRRRRGAWLRW